MIKSIITLLFLFIGFWGQAQTIQGRVTDTNGEGLPGVNVYLQDTYDGVTTDLEGNFSFNTSENGSNTLLASFIGYKSYAQLIDVASQQSLEIILKEEVSHLTGVTITAGSFEASDEKKATVLKPLDVAMTAGALADIPGALNMLPGTTTNGETGRLFVRGGTANETQAFIDGVWVNNFYTSSPNNVPSRSRFNPFLFKGTFFSTGGYSAEYGQALSSVLSLSSVDLPEENITDIGLMSVGGNVAHTQRWETGSVYGQVGYMNLDPYMSLVDQEYEWKDGFTSTNGTFMYRQKLKKSDMLKVYAAYDQSAFHVVSPNINNPNGDDVKVQNNNFYVNTSYKKELTENSMAFFGVSYGQNKEDTEYNTIEVGSEMNSIHGKSYINADIGNVSLKVGGEVMYRDHTEDTKLSDSEAYSFYYDNNLIAGFAEANYFVTNSLTFRAGLRYAYYTLLDSDLVSPRISMAYKTGTYSQLSFAYGQFHQLAQDDLLLINDQVDMEKANHYMLSYQRITQGFTLRGEVYYKGYNNLVKYGEGQFFNPTTYNNNGGGYARGIDLFFRDTNTIENGDYWISYSFIDSKRDYRDYPKEVRPDFVAMHNVSVVYKHFIPSIRTQIGASWDFNTGRPYNDPNEESFNNQKVAFFSDLSFNAAFIFKPNVILYASASNLLGRDNVFGYQFENDAGPDGTFDRAAIGQQAKRFLFVGVFISLTKNKETNQLDYL